MTEIDPRFIAEAKKWLSCSCGSTRLSSPLLGTEKYDHESDCPASCRDDVALALQEQYRAGEWAELRRAGQYLGKLAWSIKDISAFAAWGRERREKE